MDSIFKELAKQKSEFTFGKLSLSIFSVIVFFIIPCIAINNFVVERNQNTGDSQSQTIAQDINRQATEQASADITNGSNTISIPFLNATVTINSQSGLFIVVGLILVTIALILAIILLMDRSKHKKFKY